MVYKRGVKKLITILALAAQMLTSAIAAVGDVADFSKLEHVDFIQGDLTAADLEGKVVILEYWGTNCGPCVAAMPHLQSLYDKYKGQGLVIIGAEIQRSPRERIQSYLAQNKLTFPVCRDFWLPQAPLQGSLPTTVVIGADGKVVFIGKPNQVEAVVQQELAKINSPAPKANGGKTSGQKGKKGKKKNSRRNGK